jgi:hypothetical protein
LPCTGVFWIFFGNNFKVASGVWTKINVNMVKKSGIILVKGMRLKERIKINCINTYSANNLTYL